MIFTASAWRKTPRRRRLSFPLPPWFLQAVGPRMSLLTNDPHDVWIALHSDRRDLSRAPAHGSAASACRSPPSSRRVLVRHMAKEPASIEGTVNFLSAAAMVFRFPSTDVAKEPVVRAPSMVEPSTGPGEATVWRRTRLPLLSSRGVFPFFLPRASSSSFFPGASSSSSSRVRRKEGRLPFLRRRFVALLPSSRRSLLSRRSPRLPPCSFSPSSFCISFTLLLQSGTMSLVLAALHQGACDGVEIAFVGFVLRVPAGRARLPAGRARLPARCSLVCVLPATLWARFVAISLSLRVWGTRAPSSSTTLLPPSRSGGCGGQSRGSGDVALSELDMLHVEM